MSSASEIRPVVPAGGTPATLDVSIIIVSWNAKQYLLNCLESVTREAASCKAEIIVVDNGSADGSVEAVRQHFPEVVVIENGSNRGFAGGNNAGIERSKGRYLFLINSDVIVRPGSLSRLFSYMEQHAEVGLLGPKILNSDLSLQKSVRPLPSVVNSIARAFALDRVPALAAVIGDGMRGTRIGVGEEVDFVSGCFWVARRSALAKVGLLDEGFFMYAEDKDWCFRFWNAGWPVVYLRDAEAIHFGGASSSREAVRFYVEQHRANLRYWKKHHGRLGQLVIAIVIVVHLSVRAVGNAVVFCLRPSRREPSRFAMQCSFTCMRFLLRGAH